MATDSTSHRQAPKRDGAVVALAALGALLALPSAGLLPIPFLPRDPAAYGSLLTAVTAILLVGAAPARGGRAQRVLLWLLALAPFWAYAWLSGGGPVVPPLGWFALVVLACVLAWTPRRGLVAGAVVVLLGGAAVVGQAGLRLLPDGWNAVSDASGRAARPAADALHPDGARAGPRRGAAVRLPAYAEPALGEGPGPWWVRAVDETFAGPRPVVLVLDGAASRSALPAAAGLTAVHASQVEFTSAYELLAFDALLVLEGAWSLDDPAARTKAAAVVAYVRKGGLLIGPGADHDWPPHLARGLRHAARGLTPGAAGAQAFGLGRVARASHQAHVQELLDAHLWVPVVADVLTSRSGAPAWLEGLERWRDDPGGRRVQGVLLLVYVLGLAAFTRVLRGGGAQLLGVLLASAAAAAGLAWTAPHEPGFRVHGLSLDLGGPGGRRVEALLIDAGSRGFRRHVRWTGGGVLGLQGGRLATDGRLHVPPGRSAWVFRERDGRGPLAGESEDVSAAVLRPLLLGSLDPRLLRYGRLPRLPVRIEGWGPVGALTVAYRDPAE